MANTERGEMMLVANDKEYTLFLTTNACCDLEDRTGKTLEQIQKGVMEKYVRDMRWLVWAALQDRHADEIKTPAQAGALIEAAGGLSLAFQLINEFMKLNTDDAPRVEAGAKSDPPTAQAEANGADFTSALVASV